MSPFEATQRPATPTTLRSVPSVRSLTHTRPKFSNGFYLAIALISISFAGFETVLNLYLRHLHTQAVAACIRVDTAGPFTQARAE